MLAAVPDEAGARAAERATESLDGVAPALAVLFATPHYGGRTEALLTGVRSVVGRVPLIGCVAGSVVAARTRSSRRPLCRSGWRARRGRSRPSRWGT